MENLFETARLSVRKFRDEDARKLYENHMDDEVRRWFPNECYADEEEALDAIRFYADCVDNGRLPYVLGVVLNVLLACACLCGAWGTTHAAYAWTQFLGTKFWQPVVAYSDHGFLTSFFSMWYGMPIEVPRGYSQQKAKGIEKKLAKQYRDDKLLCFR